jgi:hypothetical protein
VDVPSRPELVGRTDPYFRAFDNGYPDFRRELEWEREFKQYLNLNDAYQRPMTAIFDLNQSAWTYKAITPAPIAMALGKPQQDSMISPAFRDAHPASYWALQTRGFDWSVEDRVPAVLFNQIIWKGLTGGLPYPTTRNHQDYSQDRAAVLKERSIRFSYQKQ